LKYDFVENIINDNIFIKLRNFCNSHDVFLKIESLNLGGSIKIKTAMALIRDAEVNRNLKHTKKFIESSSGNLGLSLSIIAASQGYHFTCVVDKNTNKQNIKMMHALGTHVVIIDQKDAQGGYLANRLKYIRSVIEHDPEIIWLNQYQNPANPAIHAEMTAKSILSEFSSIDYLFIGAGTTGTLMGCASLFRSYSPKTQLIAVDSVGSVIFGTPGQTRYLPGLGSSVPPHFFDASQVDKLIQIPETETVACCREVALRFGYLGGASTGTVLAAVKRLQHDIPSNANIVAISPDFGNCYVDTLYNDEWCNKIFGQAWRGSFLTNENRDVEHA